MNGQLEAALGAAMSPHGSCPDVEEIAITVLEGAEEDMARLREHADQCANCAAEIALARSWENAESDRDDLEHRRIEGVVRQVPDLSRKRLASPRWAIGGGLAAAALALLALGLPQGGAPDLPLRSGLETVVRGQEVVGLAPDGELTVAPATLSWRPLKEARSYRVTIERVDGELVHSGETAQASYSVADLTFEPDVRYVWRVEATSEESVIAASEEASLRVASREVSH